MKLSQQLNIKIIFQIHSSFGNIFIIYTACGYTIQMQVGKA
jgi:hypothetical protein